MVLDQILETLQLWTRLVKCLPPWKENLSVEQNLLGKLRKDHTDTREDCFLAKDPLLKLYQPVYLH